MRRLVIVCLFAVGCEPTFDAGFIQGVVGPIVLPMTVTFGRDMDVSETYRACDRWNDGMVLPVLSCERDTTGSLENAWQPGFISIELTQIYEDATRIADTSIVLNRIGEVVSAGIRVSPDYPISEEVLVHEMGHALGFEHDEEIYYSCMHNPVPIPCEITGNDRSILGGDE